MASSDIYGLGASGIPPELAAEMLGIKGRKAIAQALYEQSMQPLQAPAVKGRFSVPVSPLQGVAKLAQAYVGQKGLTEADKSMAGVGEKYQKGVSEALTKAEQIRQGTPAVEYTPGVSQAPVQPQAAVPGNPQEAVKFALQNQYLQNHPYAKFMTERLGKAEDLSEASKLRSEEQRIAREENAANREALLKAQAELRPEPAPIQVTDSAGNVRLVDRQGNLIKDLGKVGKPSATFEKTAAAKKKLGTDINQAITELEKATADGGLIDKSTGSGAGALVDTVAGFFGKATPGAIAVGQMAPVFDLVLKMVPRFEGPQSDKDTQSYREAAGQLANPAVPNEQKKAAGKIILRLMKERKNQFISKDMESLETDDSGWKDL